MVTRGTLVIDGANTSLTLSTEEVSVQAGLIHKNMPLLSSEQAWQMAVWGRGREIMLEGQYAGTQAQIETFLGVIEEWVNENLSAQTTARYYPMFHKDNTLAASNGQSAYWSVLCDSFVYKYDEVEPTRITFTMTLREGTKLGVFNITSGGS